MARCRPIHREGLTTRKSDEAPELGKLPRRNGDRERKNQPVERRRYATPDNINATSVMDSADDRMTPPLTSHRKPCGMGRSGGCADWRPNRPCAQH